MCIRDSTKINISKKLKDIPKDNELYINLSHDQNPWTPFPLNFYWQNFVDLIQLKKLKFEHSKAGTADLTTQLRRIVVSYKLFFD